MTGEITEIDLNSLLPTPEEVQVVKEAQSLIFPDHEYHPDSPFTKASLLYVREFRKRQKESIMYTRGNFDPSCSILRLFYEVGKIIPDNKETERERYLKNCRVL